MEFILRQHITDKALKGIKGSIVANIEEIITDVKYHGDSVSTGIIFSLFDALTGGSLSLDMGRCSRPS